MVNSAHCSIRSYYRIVDMTAHDADLEEVFLAYYREQP